MKKHRKALALFGLVFCGLLILLGLCLAGYIAPASLLAGLGGLPFIFGTTLAADKGRVRVIGDRNEIPVIASDIIYEGAAIGVVAGTGHARPLTSVDKFGGFAESKADNSSGAAAAINVRTITKGVVKLSVSGAVITDIGQPVYATDDDTFVFLPTGAVFIGFIRRFVSSGVVEVEFDALNYQDPYGGGKYESITGATKTLDIEDNGKTFFVTITSVVTMPAVATPVNCKLVNLGPFGTVQISIDPAAADKVQGPDLPGTDNKDLINTLATAKRGDFVNLVTGDANGPIVSELKGTWATEA